MKEGYIKKKTSTIPFGYAVDPEVKGYLKPIEKQIAYNEGYVKDFIRRNLTEKNIEMFELSP